MKTLVKGVSEEEYGLWINNGKSHNIEEINHKNTFVTYIGFELENSKNFQIDIECINQVIFLKVHNDRTYDIYREHLITLIKVMILNSKLYNITIFIVSDKSEDYKNELNSFFNLSTRYTRGRNYGQLAALLKCFCMRFIGFKITNRFLIMKKIVKKINKKSIR